MFCPSLLGSLLLTLPAAGIPAAGESDAAPSAGPAAQVLAVEKEHSIDIGGRRLAYRTLAETVHLRDDEGAAEAEFFTMSYLAEGSGDAATRPITFAFNGGPGSASVWLHLGLLGPRLVKVPSDAAAAGAPPYPLVENSGSLLAVSDLVFVDPIGTGFSRALKEKDESEKKPENDSDENPEYWEVAKDLDSLGEFIQRPPLQCVRSSPIGSDEDVHATVLAYDVACPL